MKRIYIKPELITIANYGESLMLSQSQVGRKLGGGPSADKTGDIVIPTEIKSYDGEMEKDPYGGHGQGTGGAGNRGKGFDDVWEDD